MSISAFSVEPYVLAVDLGTSGCKTALVSLSGQVGGWAFRAVTTQLLPGAGSEQRPEGWGQAFLDTAREFWRPAWCRWTLSSPFAAPARAKGRLPSTMGSGLDAGYDLEGHARPRRHPQPFARLVELCCPYAPFPGWCTGLQRAACVETSASPLPAVSEAMRRRARRGTDMTYAITHHPSPISPEWPERSGNLEASMLLIHPPGPPHSAPTFHGAVALQRWEDPWIAHVFALSTFCAQRRFNAAEKQ